MHTICGTMLRTSSNIIRNFAYSEGETGTRGYFRLSHAVPRHIHTAKVITQPQKIHSQLVGIMAAVTYQLAGLTCSFVYGMGAQNEGVIHNYLAGQTHHLLFLHVRPANTPNKGSVPLPWKGWTPLVHSITCQSISATCIISLRLTQLWMLHNRQRWQQ